MLRMFLLVFIVLLQQSYGDLPSLCSDGYLEVTNGTETKFTCSNFLGAQTIRWYFKGNTMATCSPLQSQNEQPCDVTYLPSVFTVSRTSPTTSVVTVKSIFKDKQSTLSCEITETKAISYCPVDLTYSATVSSCTVEFSGSTWTVSSQCYITKVYSSHGRYRCDLYQRIQNDPAETRVDSSTMSTSSVTEANYFSGYCNMTSFLPSEGIYTYRVVLTPGYVNVTPPFNGNDFIRTPKGKLSHNCPTSVSEYGNLQCACSVTDKGSPQGEIRWRNASTNEILLNNVTRAQNGVILTCALTWNRTEIQFLTYTVIVTYPPSDIQFKINDIETLNASVKENSTVRMVCLADGRPTPSMRLISIDKKSVLNSSPRGNVTLSDIRATVTHDIEVVQCEDTGEYECEVDTGPGQIQKRLSLFVMCAPRQTTQDFYSATFNGGEARLAFKIIAYPPPDELSVFYIGSSQNDTTSRKVESKNTFAFVCTYDNLLWYMVICTVTLHSETIFSAGVYHAVFRNGLGNILLTFEIREQVDTTGQSKAEVAGPVAGGVIGAVVVIALAVTAVIFIIRRKRRKFEGGSRTTPAMTSKTEPQRNVETLYEQLQRGDVNKPSVYQTLGPQQTSSDFTDHEDQGRSHVYEFPVDLHENTRGTHQKETIYQNSTFS